MTKKPKRSWSCFFGSHNGDNIEKEYHYDTGNTSAWGKHIGLPDVPVRKGYRTMNTFTCTKPGCSHVSHRMVSDSLSIFEFIPYRCDKYGNKT